MNERYLSVGKVFTFHAAHYDEEADDKCGNLHGHTYKLEIEAAGVLPPGERMLIHGDVLKSLYRERIEPVTDHRSLNATCPTNPTMENVLLWLTDIAAEYLLEIPNVTGVYVRLWETPTMYAETIRKMR
jgi:6-pyruvoyltetrahydropterin/6-carboxytetrahydropterin synthase